MALGGRMYNECPLTQLVLFVLRPRKGLLGGHEFVPWESVPSPLYFPNLPANQRISTWPRIAPHVCLVMGAFQSPIV